MSPKKATRARSSPPAAFSVVVPPGQASLHPSFEQLYERWFDTVSRWVAALGTHEADREDVVQEVFMVAYRRLSDFDGENEAGWLYQIARRKVRDYRRLLWVKHLFARSSVPVEGTMLWTNRGPLDELETRQKCRLLLQLLDTLNADQRAAFVLFEIEGVSGEEIAALAGVPVNTVWGRIFKARQHLQRKLLRRDASKSHGSVSMRR